MNERRLTILEHIRELRLSLIRSFIALAVSMAASLFFAKQIFYLLQRPLLNVLPPDSGFIATSPLEALITYLKVALLTGVFISSPAVLFELWRFIAPGLHQNERKLGFIFVCSSTLFFVGGALFGYFFIFPIGFRFFVTALEGTNIRLLPQMEDYLAFISRMLLTFGFLFELPLVLVLLAKIGLIRHAMLAKARRYVLVLIFLVAGILTPGPDVLSQFLLAIPLLFLYEISALVIWIMERKK